MTLPWCWSSIANSVGCSSVCLAAAAAAASGVQCSVVVLSKLSLISISLHIIVIHTFCTCIIIIIPSLSPFATFVLALAWDILPRCCRLLPPPLIPIESKPSASFHYFQPHNIIVLPPKKNLIHYYILLPLLYFFFVCDCIFRSPVSKSSAIHAHTHILEFMLMPFECCVSQRTHFVLRLLFIYFL